MDQIDTAMNNYNLLLLKFGKKEHLQDVLDGKLYMKNIDYYRKLENETGDEEAGDKNEALSIAKNVTVTLLVDGEVYCTGSSPDAVIDSGYGKIPIFCMFIVDFMKETKETVINGEPCLEYKIPEKQAKKMRNFGDYFIVIRDVNEFLKRVKNATEKNRIELSHGYVEYCKKNTNKNTYNMLKEPESIPFSKDIKYKEQNEYRLLLNINIEDNYTLDIDSIADIAEIVSLKEIDTNEISLYKPYKLAE